MCLAWATHGRPAERALAEIKIMPMCEFLHTHRYTHIGRLNHMHAAVTLQQLQVHPICPASLCLWHLQFRTTCACNFDALPAPNAHT